VVHWIDVFKFKLNYKTVFFISAEKGRKDGSSSRGYWENRRGLL
jgi:hypothetical protein